MFGLTVIRKDKLQKLNSDLEKSKKTVTLKIGHIKELNFQLNVVKKVNSILESKLHRERNEKGHFVESKNHQDEKNS